MTVAVTDGRGGSRLAVTIGPQAGANEVRISDLR
jgi:hypothetical protein